MKCASCKNKTSDEQCPSRPLKGLILCGKHARSRNVRMWKDVNNLDDKATIIQKIWRGYNLRMWLKLAGPGVLNRKVCHNDEEIFSFDKMTTINPLDYFAFEEDGKIYAFDVRSITEANIFNVNPTNPYNRQLLTIDTRQRMRKICIRRQRRNIANLHDLTPKKLIDIIRCGWICVCQIIGENGFFDMPPEYFITMNRTQYVIFVTLVRNDILAWAAEHKRIDSRRYKYAYWLKRILAEYNAGANSSRLSYLTSKVLSTILNDYPEPYAICFIIMSAMHRL
jgi:hypothetical protein